MNKSPQSRRDEIINETSLIIYPTVAIGNKHKYKTLNVENIFNTHKNACFTNAEIF